MKNEVFVFDSLQMKDVKVDTSHLKVGKLYRLKIHAEDDCNIYQNRGGAWVEVGRIDSKEYFLLLETSASFKITIDPNRKKVLTKNGIIGCLWIGSCFFEPVLFEESIKLNGH